MKIIAQTDYTIGWKVFMYGCIMVFCATAAWTIPDALREKNFGYVYVYAVPSLIGCLAALFYLPRHKLELSETTLRQHGFFTKTIFLEDVEDVSENMGAYTIKSGKKSISITNGLQGKDQFKEQLIAQLKKADAEKNRLPGTALHFDESHNLILQIQHMVNMGIQADTMAKAAASPFIEQLSEPSYYLVYEHPNHDFLNRAYDTDGVQVKVLINRYIEPTGAPNMDVWVLPHGFEWLMFCGRDGELFYQSSK